MKNPKPAGGRGSSQKNSATDVPDGADGRKPRWESSKNHLSEHNNPSDSKPFKEDVPGPSAVLTRPTGGPGHPVASLPPPMHMHPAASSPPRPPYGFHNLERRTIVLADGTARSYFALPPDYQMEPRGDRFFHHGHGQGLDPHFPPHGLPSGPDGFREIPQSYARGGADYWSSLGLDGPAGPSSLKRKYGEEEFAWHRQQGLQHGSSSGNPVGFPSGSIGDSLGRSGSPARRDHLDDSRLPKQIKSGDEGYDDPPSRKQKKLGDDGHDDPPSRGLRSEDNRSLVAKDVDKKALKDAFLRLSKAINENPSQRKNYLEDGKNTPLQCIVCGRGDKDVSDVHGLIMHAYNSQNSDLGIEHLGLHKALCVMMGWDYSKAPDNFKEYQSLSVDDAKANMEDLILWPPTVILHNAITQKRLNNKEMDLIIKELGFGGGKAKVLYGKYGNMGITAVRFSETEAGLLEAESMADFFENNDHGRKDWACVTSNTDEKSSKVDKKTGRKSLGFYGYLATPVDIDKVDFEMKKTAVIKSRTALDLTD